jgi:hypothetical protein
MPGYGIVGPEAGSGLLPWRWAEERLASSRNYWLATAWPDGRPHVMPVWGLWHERSLWFSSSLGSRKAHNLLHDPRCVVTTEDALDPVVVEGRAEHVTDLEELRTMLALENAKYGTSYGMETLDPTVNAAFRVRPLWAFGLRHDDFSGSPTRWDFSAAPGEAPGPRPPPDLR